MSEAMGLKGADKTARRKASEEIARLDLIALTSLSAVGLARSTASASREEQAAAARKAWRTLEAYGPPPDLSPFDVIPIIGTLPPSEAERFGAALVDVIERRRLQLEKGEVPEGITHKNAIAVVRAAQQRQAKRLEQHRAVYTIVGKLGLAMAQRAAGDAVRAEKTAAEAIEGALETRLGGPQAIAFGIGFEMAAACDRLQSSKLMDIFLMALSGTIEVDPAFFASHRIRALFDGPIAAATGIFVEQLGGGNEPIARRRASAILDLLRTSACPHGTSWCRKKLQTRSEVRGQRAAGRR